MGFSFICFELYAFSFQLITYSPHYKRKEAVSKVILSSLFLVSVNGEALSPIELYKIRLTGCISVLFLW